VRILVSVSHRYPASIGGPGGGRIFDFVVKGLAELGHDVFYHLREGAAAPPPDGVSFVERPIEDVDILHCRRGTEPARGADTNGTPWVLTCHTDIQIWGMSRDEATGNWIYISRTLAETYGSTRYVMAGIDPSELVYSETKGDYFLFVAAARMMMDKGLDIAASLSRKMGFELVVAGGGPAEGVAGRIASFCKENGAKYVGEVYGARKAELFAGAKALLFPTKVNEAFGLVMAEALMSGTPVICSSNGACPELIPPDVGFVCANEADYEYAVEHAGNISPRRCRDKAMNDYHYLRMAREYVSEYEKEISRRHGGRRE
jgi:glycosyltransferase involved in cell wall biosynthesis